MLKMFELALHDKLLLGGKEILLSPAAQTQEVKGKKKEESSGKSGSFELITRLHCFL